MSKEEIKNKMQERENNLLNKKDIQEDVIPTIVSKKVEASSKSVIKEFKYNLSIDQDYHKFLKKLSAEQETNVKALIIKAIEKMYPDIKSYNK